MSDAVGTEHILLVLLDDHGVGYMLEKLEIDVPGLRAEVGWERGRVCLGCERRWVGGWVGWWIGVPVDRRAAPVGGIEWGAGYTCAD